MTYNPNIPQPTDNISVSQGDILGNFGQLNTLFDLNHFAWDSVSDAGLHRVIDFPVPQGAGSMPAGAASRLYTTTISTLGELFFRTSSDNSVVWRGGSGTGLIQTNISGSFGSNHYVFPNGLILKWGSAAASGTVPQTITYDSTIPFTSWSLPFPVLSNGGRTFGVSAPSSNTTSFNISTSPTAGTGYTIYYFAIGF